MAGESQSAIRALHARGWTDTAIGRMVGRDSSLIHQISVGKKPGTNLAGSLEALRGTGLPGPKSAKTLPAVRLPEAPRRVRASGQEASVRESGKRDSHAGGALILPNGQRRITGHTKASARFVAGLSSDLGPNNRVKVVYQGVDGRWHTLAQKGGMSPQALRAHLGSGKNWRDALAELIAIYYPKGTAPAPTGEAEFFIVSLGRA